MSTKVAQLDSSADQMTKEEALIRVKKYWGDYMELSEELKDDKEILMSAIGNNGWALKYSSERLRDDKEAVLSALCYYGLALEYASERLQDDKDVVMAAVSNDSDSLEYASIRLQWDTEILNLL